MSSNNLEAWKSLFDKCALPYTLQEESASGLVFLQVEQPGGFVEEVLTMTVEFRHGEYVTLYLDANKQ
jgi:hypothetical protein